MCVCVSQACLTNQRGGVCVCVCGVCVCVCSVSGMSD